MRGIALALGGLPDEFEGERGGDAFWVFRLIGYPGHQLQMENAHQKMTSDGLLTLVKQDENITALQVRNQSGEWISAPPIPGTFVSNIDDMLKPNYDAAVEPLEVCVQRSGGTW
ncbi:hypothetical protein REPUB_Repub10bG0140100 [Reevesia pubescens]